MKRIRLELCAGLAVMLTACSSTPARQVTTQAPVEVIEAQPAAGGRGGYLAGDGPAANTPANLEATPDAVPRAEPLHKYANRPYVALGVTYTPQDKPGSYKERGIASWYGKKFHGQRTSSGETYDMYAMTAAHPTLPIPSYARITHAASNKSVIVRINDRGPFLHGRIIDLSYTAAHKLGIIGNGSGEVEVESLAPDATIAPLAVAEPVKVEPLLPEVALPAPPVPPLPVPLASASQAASPDAYLQLGAFKSQQGAESFLVKMRSEFEGSGKQVSLFRKDDLVRVHIGPYPSADEARATAEKLQERLGFKPILSMH